MVTEWEEVEVEEESIEYQWTDKLTTMDADKDGKVTIQEQQAWMVQQSPRVQQEMMRAMDSNQDGTVTVAEQQVSVSLPLSPSLPLSNLLVYIMDRCIYAFKQHHTLSQTYTVQCLYSVCR